MEYEEHTRNRKRFRKKKTIHGTRGDSETKTIEIYHNTLKQNAYRCKSSTAIFLQYKLMNIYA